LKVVRPEGGKKKYVSRRGRDRVRGAGSLSIESSDGGYWLPKKRTGVESSRSRRGAPVAPVEKEEIRDLGIRSIEREAQSDGGRSDNHSDNGSVEEHKEENGEGDDDIREESGDVSECGIIEGGDPGDTPGTVSTDIETRQSRFKYLHHSPLTTLTTGLTKQRMCSSFLFRIFRVSQMTFLPLSCRSC
jgi:hypothetical protein